MSETQHGSGRGMELMIWQKGFLQFKPGLEHTPVIPTLWRLRRRIALGLRPVGATLQDCLKNKNKKNPTLGAGDLAQ